MFPKSVTVKGQKYKIDFKKIEPSYMGTCHKLDKQLHFNTDYIKTHKEALPIYAHELCHAYLHEYNLDVFISGEIEELICLMVEDIAEKVKDFVNSAPKKSWDK